MGRHENTIQNQTDNPNENKIKDLNAGSNNVNSRNMRQYYERLLKEAEEEGKRLEARDWELNLAEDPMGINYARWATEEEIKESLTEILSGQEHAVNSGVPLFCHDGTTYVDGTDSHSMIIGASGSKKTRLFILPSILMLAKAGESMIITDPKAELYERTSGHLKENGYKIYCVNFRDDSRQNCWNPLDAPRQFFRNGKFDLAVGLLNDFSTISVPKDNRGGDPFWDDSARSAFMGMLLLIFLLAETPEAINIRSLLRLRNTLFEPAESAPTQKSGNNESRFRKLFRMLDPGSLAASYLSVLATAPERTLGSILATLDTHLIKFIMRPDLTDMLCHNDIDFRKIGHEKTAIFLVMPDEKETYHGLISIFVQQCYESLIFEAQTQPGKTLPRRVNFLLDEFSSLPPIKEFPAMIAAARSRNIRFNIVVQSEKQLRSRYREEADTIKGNCNNWIFLYSRELQTLEELSRLCGNQKSGNPLVTPSRLQRLNKEKGEVLIIHGRQYPFLSHLDDISLYDHDVFLSPSFEECKEAPIQVFMLENMMKEHTEEWITAKLAQNTVKQLETEEMERKIKEEKHLEELKQKVKENTLLKEELSAAKQQMNTLCCLPVQKADISENLILEASRKWYENTFSSCSLPGFSDIYSAQCSLVELPMPSGKPEENYSGAAHIGQKEPTQSGRFLPESPFPLNCLSLTAELNAENMAVFGSDRELLSCAAHQVYRRVLASGQSVPIFFDMKDLKPDWNATARLFKSFNLLLILLARQLFGGDMAGLPAIQKDQKLNTIDISDIAGPLGDNIKLLWQEFSAKPEGMPKYLLILNHMEDAFYKTDAVWQAWDTAKYPNVHVLVTTTEKELLTANCCSYLHLKGGHVYGSPNILFFDEQNNEVKMKQSPAPTLCLEVTTCCPS